MRSFGDVVGVLVEQLEKIVSTRNPLAKKYGDSLRMFKSMTV